jgi:hypothetical protein
VKKDVTWTDCRVLQVVPATPGVWWTCYRFEGRRRAGEEFGAEPLLYFALCDARKFPLHEKNPAMTEYIETVFLPFEFRDGYFEPLDIGDENNYIGFTYAENRAKALIWARAEFEKMTKGSKT